MARKTVRQMNFLERMRYSLSLKLFRTIIWFSLVLSIAAIAFGFYLYSQSVNKQYSAISNNIAKTARLFFFEEDANHYIDDVLKIYESIPETEISKGNTSDYLKQYNTVKDDRYKRTRTIFHTIQAENKANAIYFAAYDTQYNRLIYIMDSDYSSNYRPPGYIDTVNQRQSSKYLDVKLEVPANIEKSDDYGYICTGWDTIRRTDRYIISAYTDIDMNKIMKQSRSFLIQYFVILFIVTVLLDIIITQKLKHTIVTPITSINQAARDYIVDKGIGKLEHNHFSTLNIRTGDEIESLALIMAEMEKDIKDYIENLTKVTGEKERMGAELNIASQIQEGVLPSVFPPFPDRKEFDIYAVMDPAKEVGGDFYDFFMIDDDHLALVIADVSGKGIPGALFMMASKILISNITSLGIYDPGTILTTVNEQINKSNPAEMFVTVWLGILEISTGKLIASNAGHEYPCIMKSGGRFELLKDKHGFVIGGMPDCTYTSYEMQLNPGDCVFVYTDGVPEATSEKEELFGTERLLQSLNKDPNASTEQLIRTVLSDIDAFVLEAPQFDDTTMLALRYFGGKKKNMEEMTVEATIENITKVTEFVDKKLEEFDCPVKAQMQIDVAIDELFSNIANYAYNPDTGPATVRVEVEENPMAVVITFIDNGKPYDPLKNEDPDITLSAEERGVGGLGVFLVKKTMDDVSYEYKDGQNILRIKKHI